MPVEPLLSNGEISVLNLPKSAVIKTKDLTPVEITTIEINLARVQNGKLSKRLLKKIY